MSATGARGTRILKTIDAAWTSFTASFDGLLDARMLEPGVTGDWSVKDVLAHVTIWEEEALKYLPLIAEGGRPPKYATLGGIDSFNTQMVERRRSLTLAEVRRQLEETHRRLRDYVAAAPEDLLTPDTRFRRRLRFDTYSHYPEHAEAIREWRERS
jgi:DinB superfamily